MLTTLLLALMVLDGAAAAAKPPRQPEKPGLDVSARPGAKPPARTPKRDQKPHTVEMHIGVPGVAYVGQPLKELLKVFPDAKMTAFAGQADAFVVQVPEAGISAYAVGATPDSLMVASVGFVFDETYQGISSGAFRSSKGIGRGSTVNDLLEAYGQPTQIARERPRAPMKVDADHDDPAVPRKYHYASPDGTVTTYFVVKDNLVRRMVVNQRAALDQYIIKRHPGETPPEDPEQPPGL